MTADRTKETSGLPAAQRRAPARHLKISTPPHGSSKRQRSRESRNEVSRPGASNQRAFEENSHVNGKAISAADLRLPHYLSQDRSEIQRRFHDLEWHQRFRIQHGYTNPENSPFRIDKSEVILSRNRYGNVQPWDCSRIRLRHPIGGSDYINASPITLRSRAATRSALPSTGPATSTSVDPIPECAVQPSQLRYIATQGPKDDQFEHFWNMVLQETVGPVAVIVMLTQLYEGNKEKCSQYFPRSMEDPVIVLSTHIDEEAGADSDGDPFLNSSSNSSSDGYGGESGDFEIDVSAAADSLLDVGTAKDAPPAGGSDGDANAVPVAVAQVDTHMDNAGEEPAPNPAPTARTVTLLSLRYDTASRSEIRHMKLETGAEGKEIYHYWFNGWSDYGKPEGEDRRALRQLAKQSNDRAGTPANPRFVHCSAGVGRTGTFIALDFLMSELEKGHLVEPKADETASEKQDKEDGEKPETWGKSGPVKESTPESTVKMDPVYETVNQLREQRMMMVMNEVQFSFLYEVLREAFVEQYASLPKVGVVDDVSSGDAGGGRVVEEETGEPSPKLAKKSSLPFAEIYRGTVVGKVKGDEDTVSEASTEVEDDEIVTSAAPPEDGREAVADEDPYRAAAPESVREGIGRNGGFGA